MPWNYLILDAKHQHIQLDVNRIPDKQKEEFIAAALNAKYQIKYFDAYHVQQFGDETSDEEKNENTQSALDLIYIQQNPLYASIEVMVAVEIPSQSKYDSFVSAKVLYLSYDIKQSIPLQIDYKLNAGVDIRSKSAIIIQKNGAINIHLFHYILLSSIVDPIKYPKLEGKTDKIMEWIKANETRIPELERKAFVNEISTYCDDKKMKGNLGKVWKEYKVANDRTRGGTISLVSDSSII
eukprot:917620_1